MSELRPYGERMQTSSLAVSPLASRPVRAGAVTGTPRALLRLEGGALLVASLVAFASLELSWVLFVALFLVPDLSMLGYLAGPRTGAAAYNAAHTLLVPAALAAVAVADHRFVALALIWCAHIGFDRVLGYGLKYETAFRHTHLS